VFDSLLAALDALPSCCSVVMLGDFNARTASALPVSPGAAHGLSYPWPCRLSLDPCSNPRGRVLLSLCSSYLLAIANGSASGNSSSLPSRCDGTPSVVDYALLSYDLCAHSSLSIFPPFADSDHVPFSLSVPVPLLLPPIPRRVPFSHSRFRLNYPRVLSLPPFAASLSTLSSSTDLPTLVVSLSATLSQASLSACPPVSRRSSSRHAPWWNAACSAAHTFFRSLARSSPASYATGLARQSYRRLCAFRRRVYLMSSAARTTCLFSLSPHRFWASFSPPPTSHVAVPPSAWTAFASSYFSPPALPPDPLVLPHPCRVPPTVPLASEPVSLPVLQAALGRLRRYRAPDSQGLRAEHLRDPALLPVLLTLLSLYVSSLSLPPICTEGLICPVHKRGSVRSPLITACLPSSLSSLSCFPPTFSPAHYPSASCCVPPPGAKCLPALPPLLGPRLHLVHSGPFCTLHV